MQENTKPKFEIIEDNKLEVSQNKNKTVTITDSLGRIILLKKPSVLDQYRLVEILGAELSANQVYMGMVIPLLFVQSIDNIPVIFSKKTELEALIKRLDEEGIDSVVKAVNENFIAQNGEEEKEKIKK